MSQRISLTRIIALNWYGFRQIFDVSDNVLISGSFGTGKSALLDLIQYVMLGEGWRANRAAAGSGRGRDLVGYCLGDTNQLRNGERHFLRASGVTVVALEFTRPALGATAERKETWGVRLEYASAQASPKHTYFCVPARIEYSDLTDGKQLLDDDRFRTWIRREFGHDCVMARQKDYLAEMATHQHLYFDRDAFQRTFPKAIAFEPEDNVEKFIRDFILEESPLDVRDVRGALNAYEDTRQRLAKQEDEAVYLRRISEHHARFEKNRREGAILRHTQSLLELQQQEELRDRHAAALQKLEQDNAAQLRELAQAGIEVANLEKLLREIRFEIGQDPDEVKLNQLIAERRVLQERVVGLREVLAGVRQRLDTRHYQWAQWQKHGSVLPLDGLKTALVIDDQALASLRAGPESDRLKAMQTLAARFTEIWEVVKELMRPIQQDIASIESRLRQLAADKENLDRGQTPGAFPVFEAIRQKLGSRVEQLARLIEVKPDCEEWWPALEVFLGRNRWTIVVEDENDYREALSILRRTSPGREGESLMNPTEAEQMKSKILPQTLLAKVAVLHPIARKYVEHLLGDVVCVPDVADLERTDAARAITPEGIFKQVPLRRRLKPATSVPFTLGREGLQRMRAAVLKEQGEGRIQLVSLQRVVSDVFAWLDAGKKNGLGDHSLPDRAGELPELPALNEQLKTLGSTIEWLSTPERTERQKRLTAFEGRKTELDQKMAVLTNEGRQYDNKAAPHRDGKEEALDKIGQLVIKVQEERSKLGRQYEGILDRELIARRDELRVSFPKWQECFNHVLTQASVADTAGLAARSDRSNERRKLADVRDARGALLHPEYQHEFNADADDNSAWGQRLLILEQVELEKSRKLAEERRRDWERRLEESVLKELKSRTDAAVNAIKLLDKHLSQPVGKYRYRITYNRDNAGYGAIWRLLDTGFEETDPLTAAIHESEVERAKEELMKAVNETAEGNERAKRLLDYRNYHHFDIVMVPADRPDAPPISLGRSGRNLSGGENQAPFFISMLAAFRRVYDRGDRQSTRTQQLGLVVMDEAFSKLSGDGIEDCLALARSFQLQLIMAFPPERLGVMVPHAQTVVMCRKEMEFHPKDNYVTRIDNVPMIMTVAEAMEALE